MDRMEEFMQEQKQAVLSQKIKIDQLPMKKLIPQAGTESMRPMPSLKRRKTFKPKALIPSLRKTH